MRSKIEKLTILVGYKCNFRCSHCIVAEKQQAELSLQEVSMLRDLLASFTPESLLFIGGEPTLYIEKINSILAGPGISSKTSIVITTNGHFARTLPEAVSTLKSFKRLDHVQLSYDNYHKKFVSLESVGNLRRACASLGLRFGVLVSIQSPLDLVLLNELKSAGVEGEQVRVQGVQLIGAAAANNIGYTYPSFNEQVLSRKCESIGNMVYLCGEGFTSCCSHLAFEKENRDYVHPTIERHLDSKFYRLITTHTFSELAGLAGIRREDFLPEHSHLCALCGFIFRNLRRSRPELVR